MQGLENTYLNNEGAAEKNEEPQGCCCGKDSVMRRAGCARQQTWVAEEDGADFVQAPRRMILQHCFATGEAISTLQDAVRTRKRHTHL